MDSKRQLLCLFLYFIPLLLAAQINQDSFRLAVYQQAQTYKAQDSLAAWVNTYFDAADVDQELYLSYYDSILLQQWRPAKDSIEAEALLMTAFYARYYFDYYGDIYGSLRFCEYGNQLYQKFPLSDYDIDGYINKAFSSNSIIIGEHAKAEVILKQMLAGALEQKDNNLAASTYANLSTVHWDQAKYKTGIRAAETGLEFAGILDCYKGFLLSTLGKNYLEIEKYDTAQVYIEQAIDLLKQTKVEDCDYQAFYWLSGTYADYGTLLMKKNKQKAAKIYLDKAERLAINVYETEAKREIAKIRLLLGAWYLQNGQTAEALETYNQALSSVLKNYAPPHPYDLPEASDLFEENTIFEALTGKAKTLKTVYLANNDTEALKAALECHELAYETEQMLRAIYQVEGSKLQLQKSSRARDEEALEIAYLLYQRTRDKSYAEKAFQIAEQSKSTILLDALAENLLKKSIAENDDLLLQEQKLKRYIGDYERSLLEVENKDVIKEQLLKFKEELAAVKAAIRQKYPQREQQLAQQKQFSLDAASELLQKENEHILEYFVAKEALYIFTLSSVGELILEKRAFKPLLQDIRSFIQLSSDRVAFQNDPKSFYELSHRLYKKLLPESIQARVEKGEILDLTIVPDAVLNVCAFDALLTQKDVKGTVPYLIHKANISYTYSIVSLQYQKQLKNENNKNVLSVIPVFEAQERGLATLEYSTYEKSNMPTLHSQLLLKEQATRRAFLSNFKDFKVLHFSTHAEADSAQIPRIEFIDSTLFLPEIYGLPLQNDLVVLSACQTAIGTENSGEGLMSLARAFAYAGAPSLVASLWKVNNKSTSDLMTAFYRHLNDDHSKSAALRQAKLDYLSEASIAQQSPYYWSGMIFMGADDVVAFERTIPIHFWLLGLGVLLLLGFLVFSLISNSLSKKT